MCEPFRCLKSTKRELIRDLQSNQSGLQLLASEYGWPDLIRSGDYQTQFRIGLSALDVGFFKFVMIACACDNIGPRRYKKRGSCTRDTC